MTQDIQPHGKAPFDMIRHSDESGEYWSARELMPLLEYEHWQDFDGAITRAIEDCAKSGRSVDENFEVFRRSPKNRTGQKFLNLIRNYHNDFADLSTWH